MRSALLAVLIAALVIALPASRVHAAPADSTLQGLPLSIDGTFGDSWGETITIGRLLPGVYHLVSTAGWEGVGFLQNGRYDGVFRTASPARNARGHQVILSRDDGALEVHTTNEGSDQTTIDIWHRRQEHFPNGPLEARDEYPYVEQLPEVVLKVPASYPAEARKAGIQGTVMLQALVMEDGTVLDTKILKGIPLLDDAAVDCVRQWRFKPALDKGKPVPVWVAVPIKFSLH
jgi:TonB family protein